MKEKTLKILKCVLFFSAASVFALSCANLVDSDSPVETVLQPISAGNYWRYQIYHNFYSSGEIIPGLSDSLLETIDEEIMINIEGKIYKGGVKSRRFGKSYYEEVRWIYVNLNDGLYYLGGAAEKDTIFFKSLFLKSPVKKGQTWHLPYVYYHSGKEQFVFLDTTTIYTCLSTKEKFSTEAGEFNCIVYHFREKPAEDVLAYWDYYLYYSPGLGIVGVEIKSSLDKRMITKVVLTNYKIN